MDHGFWITRSPAIRKEEWRAFIASELELDTPSDQFGEFPANQESAPNLPEFAWWTRSNALPAKVLFTSGRIFIEAGDAEAAALARRIAQHFGGTEQEA